MKSDSKERMLDAAAELMRRQGYAATGMNEIVRASGAPKGSLYFHFPGGKEQLAACAIERSSAAWHAVIDEELAAATGTADACLRVCQRLAKDLEESGFVDGCPVATIALETDSETLRATCKASFDAWLKLIQERVQAAGAPEEVARRMALFVLSTIEGALLLARARHDVEPILIAGEQLAAMLAAPR